MFRVQALFGNPTGSECGPTVYRQAVCNVSNVSLATAAVPPIPTYTYYPS
jgi:hypothetical protein